MQMTRSKRSRPLAALLAVPLLLGVLAACGQAPADVPRSGATAPDSGPDSTAEPQPAELPYSKAAEAKFRRDAEAELRQLGAPPPFDPRTAEVSHYGSGACSEICPAVTVAYDGPPDLAERPTLRTVSRFLTDAGYYKSPPRLSKWFCDWQDVDLDTAKRDCYLEVDRDDDEAEFYVTLRWMGKSRPEDAADALKLEFGLEAQEH